MSDTDFGHDCIKVRSVLDRIGEKWSIIVIRMLAERPYRYNELRRAIDGISQRMLTSTLRSLERDGLVERRVTPVLPLRVDYELTPLGRSLSAKIAELTDWALDNHYQIDFARRSFDGHGMTVVSVAKSEHGASTSMP